jgi:ribosome-associated protein
MDLRKLQRIVVDALDDIKAQDIQVFNTTEQTELFDRVVIASASSNRQTRALASHLREKVKAAGGSVLAVEGEEGGEWVLVDLGDIVIHIMQPAIRSYYRLEELWGQKPVRLKVAPARAKATTGPSKPKVAARKPRAPVSKEPAAAPTRRPSAARKRAAASEA